MGNLQLNKNKNMLGKAIYTATLAAAAANLADATDVNWKETDYLGCWKTQNHWYGRPNVYIYNDYTYKNSYYPNKKTAWTSSSDNDYITLSSQDNWGDWRLTMELN